MLINSSKEYIKLHLTDMTAISSRTQATHNILSFIASLGYMVNNENKRTA